MSAESTINQVIVVTDASRNRVDVVFQGRIAPAETVRYAADVSAAIALLQPGFHLLTDLSALISMESGCIPHIERSMDVINHGGVGRIVRVIPHTSKDIGLSIMSLFHYRHGLRIITCRTREEAEQALL